MSQRPHPSCRDRSMTTTTGHFAVHCRLSSSSRSGTTRSVLSLLGSGSAPLRLTGRVPEKQSHIQETTSPLRLVHGKVLVRSYIVNDGILWVEERLCIVQAVYARESLLCNSKPPSSPPGSCSLSSTAISTHHSSRKIFLISQ